MPKKDIAICVPRAGARDLSSHRVPPLSFILNRASLALKLQSVTQAEKPHEDTHEVTNPCDANALLHEARSVGQQCSARLCCDPKARYMINAKDGRLAYRVSNALTRGERTRHLSGMLLGCTGVHQLLQRTALGTALRFFGLSYCWLPDVWDDFLEKVCRAPWA